MKRMISIVVFVVPVTVCVACVACVGASRESGPPPVRELPQDVPCHEAPPGEDLAPELDESEWTVFDTRATRRNEHTLRAILEDIRDIEAALLRRDRDQDRAADLQRVAEDYVLLSRRTEDGAVRVRPRAAMAAAKYYAEIVEEYSGMTSVAFPDRAPPAISNLDEIRYDLGVSYYATRDAPRARRALLDVIAGDPQTPKYIARAYALFGELFALEGPRCRRGYLSAIQAFERAAGWSHEKEVTRRALTRLAAVADVAGEQATVDWARHRLDLAATTRAP